MAFLGRLVRQGALTGQPQDWDLLTKIAVIDSRDWDKGADHDGRNLVDALILMGAIKAGVDAFSSVAFAILALIL